MIRRCFAHVDQALFAIERHCEHTIVFDCGGENEKIVNKAIDEVLHDEEIIDILFISHYDRDHINGIWYLLQKHPIRHIVLPMLEEPRKISVAQEMEEAGNAVGKEFVVNPVKAVDDFIRGALGNADREVPKMHFVQFWTEETNHGLRENDEEGYPRVQDIDELNDEYIAAGVALTICRKTEWCEHFCSKKDPKCQCRWIYLPFNRQTMTAEQKQKFWQEFNMPDTSNYNDVLPRWNEIRINLKKAWATAVAENEKDLKKKIEDINNYSMTLYAGCSLRGHFSACLFTGDYNAESYMKELRDAYKMLWDNIRVMQIPHHGSLKNFHEGLIVHHGIHIISNRAQPTIDRHVKDMDVINTIVSRGEIVAKNSHQHICIPDYFWEHWHEWGCGYCRSCRRCSYNQ